MTASFVDKPREIFASPEEIANKRYNSATIWKALEALHKDGFAVLKGVTDPAHVDAINKAMALETEEILKKDKGFNHNVKTNILQTAPTYKPELQFEDVYFNPFVIQVMNAYLGSGSRVKWNFMTGNNALKNTNDRQPVHKDVRFHHPECPFFVIANVPLVDFSPENGSTEFWLGSNVNAKGSEQMVATEEDVLKDPSQKQRLGDPMCPVKSTAVEARRAIRPPVQPVCQRGDIMLRDLRTWHAGMPNGTDQDRIMIALGYQAPWYPNYGLRLNLARSSANFFMADHGVEVVAQLWDTVEELKEHLHQDNFDFRPTVE